MIRATLLATMLATLLTIIGSGASYFFAIKKEEHIAKQNARRVESMLEENFEYCRKVMALAAERIYKENSQQDPRKIHRIFNEIASTQNLSDSVFTWTLFDWMNRQNQQLVNTMLGVKTNNPTDMVAAGRKYGWLMVNSPMELKFSNPTIGIPSGVYVVPIGLWIEEKGNFVGAITAGINIQKITNKVLTVLQPQNRFLVLNKEDYGFVFGSYDATSTRDAKQLEEVSAAINLSAKKREFSLSELFVNQIKIGDDRYVFSLAMNEKYPYIILTGYDSFELERQVITDATKVFLESFLASLFVLFMLRRMRNRSLVSDRN